MPVINSRFNNHHKKAKRFLELLQAHLKLPDDSCTLPDDLDYPAGDDEVVAFDQWAKRLELLSTGLYNEAEEIQGISNELPIVLYDSNRTDDPMDLEHGHEVGE
jgi:hypothetical protein